jgi:hypothetical protein
VLSRLIAALYFIVGAVIAHNDGYFSGLGLSSANGFWNIVNLVLAICFWPVLVLSSYEFRLPHALLRHG